MNKPRRVYYNKLVRDKIPEKIAKNGEACSTRTITDPDELEQELCKKIIEEAQPLATAASREEFLSEYADLLAVLDALTKHLGITPEEVAAARAVNEEKKGGYEEAVFLEWS